MSNIQVKKLKYGGDEKTPMQTCTAARCPLSTNLNQTKTKLSQLVTAPYLKENHQIIGKTTLFQVSGNLPTFKDFSSQSKATGSQPIYRIKRGSHAHVVNYMIADDFLLKKDMFQKMILDAQRECAIREFNKAIPATQQKNKKILSSHQQLLLLQDMFLKRILDVAL
ncbi:uncharacterized protein LOC108117027 [Drosophila eugracilis]|uniref:uncharacterized protein LOC108117027 n=1 Tax=Drosophila eugracilis TaxID=29029 RepID=UPI001BD94BE6|nr:uncharacterized protein LOC108117027 [Drosophila eugracilis]